MKRNGAGTYFVYNDKEVEEVKSRLSIQQLGEFRIKNIVIVGSSLIPCGQYKVVKEGLLPCLARMCGG